MIEMNNSTGSVNGKHYDFTGHKAVVSFTGEIIGVVEIKTENDVTKEFKEKYGQALNGGSND